ncbi:hypothetical protein TSUD_267020 [Trifolium subterraneum]|uniref:Uncharacterized protein n=1 Tax=Trifolium subterraneum TaxID=3900 RepID=A0A2Z6NBC3_TRISU|nr:hypothetical protein TSUD_267020 [Trifolium subterraneum]
MASFSSLVLLLVALIVIPQGLSQYLPPSYSGPGHPPYRLPTEKLPAGYATSLEKPPAYKPPIEKSPQVKKPMEKPSVYKPSAEKPTYTP